MIGVVLLGIILHSTKNIENSKILKNYLNCKSIVNNENNQLYCKSIVNNVNNLVTAEYTN